MLYDFFSILAPSYVFELNFVGLSKNALLEMVLELLVVLLAQLLENVEPHDLHSVFPVFDLGALQKRASLQAL